MPSQPTFSSSPAACGPSSKAAPPPGPTAAVPAPPEPFSRESSRPSRRSTSPSKGSTFQAESLEIGAPGAGDRAPDLPGAVRGRSGRLHGDGSRGCDLAGQRPRGRAFACSAEDLVGELLLALVERETGPHSRPRSQLRAARPEGEWIGQGVSATGLLLFTGLTAAVVRAPGPSVYRVRWSLRDVSHRPTDPTERSDPQSGAAGTAAMTAAPARARRSALQRNDGCVVPRSSGTRWGRA